MGEAIYYPHLKQVCFDRDGTARLLKKNVSSLVSFVRYEDVRVGEVGFEAETVGKLARKLGFEIERMKPGDHYGWFATTAPKTPKEKK